MGTRASSSVVGVALLVAVSVLAATAVGAATLDAAAGVDVPPRASFDARADAAAQRIALTHRGGEAVAVERLRLRITVDGRPLAHQPPIPFFAARGFASGPTGPFNVGHDGPWRVGQVASLRLAGTNAPQLAAGATVRIELYWENQRLAVVRTRAR
ncbi:MAG: type IV pilin [Haloarculaceae archaeon]